MLGSLSSSSSAIADQYRRLLQRSKTEDSKVDAGKTDEQKAAERKAAEEKAAEKKAEERRNQATEARNYLDDQGKPTDALTAVSKAASGGDEERKAQLKEKLRMLVEQLKSLLQFAMRNPAMAKALAQLSREIASVAKQLGTSGPAVNVGAAQAAAPAQAAPAQAQAAATQAAGAEQAGTAQAAAEGAAAAQNAGATQGTEVAAQPQAQNGTGEQGADKNAATKAAGAKAAEGTETEASGDTGETGETEGLGSAEMAAAHGQAILEKVTGDRPKDQSDPELKALLTLAKALTRQAKAMIEDMARDAQRAGKNDDFKEELKDASEAVKEIQKLDTGVSAEGASAGAIVSLIA